jgi:hypothetical protein
MTSEATNMAKVLRDQWLRCRERLAERHLLEAGRASLSLRWPGASMMWFGLAADPLPTSMAWADPTPPDAPAAIHAAIYRLRPDVGAIAGGGGFFGAHLADFGGLLPQVFDEQARHLGPMGEAIATPVALGRSLDHFPAKWIPVCVAKMRSNKELELSSASIEVEKALASGGNALLVEGMPFCLGTTATRMAQNAELFEKCATAYVLAAAAGGTIRPLPWLVRWIANGRMKKDQRRAAERFTAGRLPEESQGY